MTFKVSRRLSELFPGQSVLHCFSHFDVDGFVRYGGAEAAMVDRVIPQVCALWNGEERTVSRYLLTSWVEVEWVGNKFQVLRATLYKCGWVYWVVGPDPALDAFVQAVLSYSNQRGPTTHVYSGWWNESESMDRAIQESRWPDLVLREDLRRTLESQALGFFEARADYEMLGVPWKRGLLLTGPPGNGKSHVIRALLNRMTVPRLVVRNFGDDTDDVQDCFDKVREMAPCVLVLEDIDSLIRKEILSAVLNSLDGAEPLRGVLVLATTNHPEKLDPAIRNRPSRFDRVLEFGPPASKERRLLLKKLFGRIPCEVRPTASQLTRLAKETEGFSFAYLKELVIGSSGVWLRSGKSGSLFETAMRMVGELRENMKTAEASPES